MRASHYENCGIHHAVCPDPAKCIEENKAEPEPGPLTILAMAGKPEVEAPDPRCGAHCGLDAETVGGKCIPCELHGLCHLCIEEDWGRKFEEMRTENIHLKRTLKEASIDIPPIPDKLCAFCREIVGDRYYQLVPEIGNLCLPCHKEWVENETDNDHE